ncbi:hypothetical protein [Acinetobacter baumannii]|uniref:hypothetical protein n=1 Tax=Acinetobacter baumannii TaxID=470 RepID=UPI00044E1936|nr:hypothetical protein [Acinetobacter baumannii]EXB37562.1 hypothetical protein J540_3988 [Acinetobacter baumannii 1440422]MCD0196881.1 hypothetical protein [Acinetobacter baumannii]MCG5873263.1 hypothetical protein [Acinetobacter baumannii]MCJ1637031.1 hypothetical protein [Acinetobacter baumannii]MDA3469766.1 hypothetical protein [Acinetobacter baumannii]
MRDFLTPTQAVEVLKDAFKDIGCETELDDFDNLILLTITDCSTVEITRSRYSKRKKLEETIAYLKRSLE